MVNFIKNLFRAAGYQTDALSIVTICHDYAHRLRSYELVAEVCGCALDSCRGGQYYCSSYA